MRKNILFIIALIVVLVAGALVWNATQSRDGGTDNGGVVDGGNGSTDDSDDEGKPSEKDENADGIDDMTDRDEPVVSESENIKVTSPDANQYVSSHWMVIEGEARVFENSFNWRVKDKDGNELASGYGTAAAPDIGQYGPFVAFAQYSAKAGEKGMVEVYSLSARDGSEQDMVTIPVYFGKDREVSVYMTNAEMAGEGNECTEVYARERFIFDSEVPAIELRQAIWALLAGTTDEEDADGYGTSIPDGVRLNSVQVNEYGGVVTIDLSSDIETGGSCRVTAIRAQIEKTAKEILGDNYPNEFRVNITVDGGNPDEALQP